MQDDDRVREERKKAKKNKDKFVGIPSDQISSFGKSSSSSFGGGYSDNSSNYKDKDTYFSNKSIPTVGTMNDLDDKDWTSNTLSIPEVFKTATNKIKTIFDKPFDAELPDDSSNRNDSDDDIQNNRNNQFDDIQQDDDFSSNNKSSRKTTTAYKDNDINNDNSRNRSSNSNNNYANIPSEAKPSKNSLKSSTSTTTGTNNSIKLKSIKLSPVATPATTGTSSRAPRPPTPPTQQPVTEDLFKLDDNSNDEFGDFIPNTADQNFADFDNFDTKTEQTAKTTATTSNIDDLFSTLTVDTSPMVPTQLTTNKQQTTSSNIDDLFNNINFTASQPSIQPHQQQFHLPMSQTMPNIFQQQHQPTQFNPIMPNNQFRSNVLNKFFFYFDNLFILFTL